jgi:DNA invertase Pin-like site-specific DNA recombinase
METLMTNPRVAVYCRVSTDKQDNANQLLDLRGFAAKQNWNVVLEFIDTATGGTSDREQLQAMFEAAERKDFDILLFWSLDRLTREGTLPALQHLDRLQKAGIEYKALQEHFDTRNPYNDITVAVVATQAKQEKIRISERTKAGLAIARAKGVKLGGPRREFNETQLQELRSNGMTFKQISRIMNVPASTLHARLGMAVAA